jgi:hypothetical protein
VTLGSQFAAFLLQVLALAVDAAALRLDSAGQLALGGNQLAAGLGVLLHELLRSCGQLMTFLDHGLTLPGHLFVLVGLLVDALPGEVGESFVGRAAIADHEPGQDEQGQCCQDGQG